MKKNILPFISLFLLSTASFSQEKNGTIYVTHPNIDIVKKSAEAYLKKDDVTNAQLYSDTAKVWVSGQMEKPVPIKEAMKLWATDFDYYDSIQQKSVGYPDYLEYTKDSSQVVQSWWQWSGKSKKTGEIVKIDFVQFDDFKDGKIVFEYLYGDFSKIKKD